MKKGLETSWLYIDLTPQRGGEQVFISIAFSFLSFASPRYRSNFFALVHPMAKKKKADHPMGKKKPKHHPMGNMKNQITRTKKGTLKIKKKHENKLYWSFIYG